MVALTYTHLSAQGNASVALADGGARLFTVNVNTGATSAVLTIYNGTDANGDVVAVIDASAAGSFFYGVKCNDGIYAALSGGDADVTIGNA